MKRLFAIITILTMPAVSMAQANPDIGELCTQWFAYQGEAGPFLQMKEQMSEEAMKDSFPDMVRKYKIAKTKFDLAKSKYEKRSKKKFKSESCQ